MPPHTKKLGVLISVPPDHPNFRHGLQVVETALEKGAAVYLYCIDDAVTGVTDPALQALKERGVNLFACAYAAQRRGLPTNDAAAYAGLAVLSDIMAATDRFVSFN